MKLIAGILVIGLLQCVAFTGVVSQPNGFVQPPTLDMQKVERLDWHASLEHACWPNARTMKLKRHTGSVDPEIAEMRKMIDRVMREDSRPTGIDLKSKVVPLVALREGNDYLLLDYRTKAGYRVQIQDSQVFSVLVTVPASAVKNLSEIGSFVQRTAADVLAPPAEYMAEPKIRMSTLDIGESRYGSIQYGPRVSIVPEDWYTQIEWWSDGRQVLFGIYKTEKAEYDRQRATPRLEMGPLPPKVFASRKGSGK